MNIIENTSKPNANEIATRAYFLWEADGRQHGRDAEYWFLAEKHLTARVTPPVASARREPAPSAAPVRKEAAPIQKRKENDANARRQPVAA
jgi:hypothetical protein